MVYTPLPAQHLHDPTTCLNTFVCALCICLLQELKRVCLDFVSKHLSQVINTDGYRHMARSCPNLQAELLQVIATQAGVPHERAAGAHRQHAQHVRRLEEPAADERRVRQRRME